MSEFIKENENSQLVDNEIWINNKESFEEYLIPNIKECNADLDTDELKEAIQKALEKEKIFIDKMVSGVDRFIKINPQNKHLVLFDVDETIGTYNMVKKATIIRPALIPLFESFCNIYPKLQFGLISTRGKEAMQKQLSEEGDLSSIGKFINKKYLYSTEGLNAPYFKNDSEQSEWYENHPMVKNNLAQDEFYDFGTSGDLTKLKIMADITQDKNLKILCVDDFRYAKYLKEGHGIFVGENSVSEEESKLVTNAMFGF